MEKVDTLLFVCKIDKQSPSQEKHMKDVVSCVIWLTFITLKQLTQTAA